jgi:hypothetical protein
VIGETGRSPAGSTFDSTSSTSDDVNELEEHSRAVMEWTMNF